MSTVNIFGLGGLGELGKNMYVVEVDDLIFIMDCGTKIPDSELYGVDIIEPDFKYVIDNKERVAGVFLSHGHDNYIAAVPHLLQEHQFDVYASDFTNAILQDMINEEGIKFDQSKFHIVTEEESLKFKNVTVKFFRTNHSIPGSMGISIGTPDGSVVYTGNYTFDQNGGELYKTSFEKLVEISNDKVLALLPESIGCAEDINRASIVTLEFKLNNIFQKAKNRLLISLFSTNLQRIQQICNLALENKKKIAILGRKTQRIVNLAMNRGLLTIPKESLVNLKFIDEKNQNNQEDLVVLVTGERHEPYYMLQRMAKKIDRLIKLEEKDTVVILTRPASGTEKMAARTLDMLYRTTEKVHVIPKNLIVSSSASREETKTMINLLKPKYIFPVVGEFRQQYSLLDVCDCVGYAKKDSIIIENGDKATIKDGNYIGITGEVPYGEKLIDGKNIENVNDAVMRDRELLAEAGVLLIVANISPKKKKIISGPEIISQGFLYLQDHKELVEKINSIFAKVTEKHFKNKYINWQDYKNEIKQDVNRAIYKTTKSNPIIIPVVVSVD